jgi:dipeptidyl aminopeptidase/acylaminoacyl peptidase
MRNYLILMFLALASFVQAQKTPFTIEDAIKVKSIGSVIMTDDGGFIAGLITDGSSRFDTDHFRYRDPSYINNGFSELVIIESANGAHTYPLRQQKPARDRAKLSGLSWSPDGRTLAFFEERDEKLSLMLYEVNTNRLRSIRISGDPLLANISPVWMPDGKSVLLRSREKDWLARAMKLYKKATEGPVVVYDSSNPFLEWDEIGNVNSLSKVIRVEISNGAVKEILPEGQYTQIVPNESGSHIIFSQSFPFKTSYTRNEEGAEYAVGYLAASGSDSARYIYPKAKQRRNYVWSESKNLYAWVNQGNVMLQGLDDTTVIQLTKGKAFEDEEKKKEIRFSIVRWSPAEKQLLLSSSKGWWLAAVDGSKLEQVYTFPEDRDKAPDLSVIHWSADEKNLLLTISEKDRWDRGMARYNLESRQLEVLRKDSNLYTGFQFSKNGNTVILNLSDGDMPSDLVITNPNFTQFRTLTDLNPWMKNKKLTRSELITYRNVDGKELKGILYYPVDYEEGKRYPLVCEVYESFFANGYNRNMNLFANQGYFVLRPSVDLEMGYPGEGWVKGITSAINMLVDQGKVDNDKVGVQGVSYGGYATSLLITQTDRFAAAINISGKVNIISFLGDSPKIGTRNYNAAEEGQDRIGASLWDAPLKYMATTAVLYADRIKTPHMIMTGEGDWNVPATNSRELYYAMRRLGKEVVWVNYMLGGHGAGAASNESDFYDHWERVFAFYDKHFNKKKEEKTNGAE